MSYGGDEDSKLGSGTIYATPSFGLIRNGKPRYDFVVVDFGFKEGNKDDDIAQVITFLKLASFDEDGKFISASFYAIVKCLKVLVKKDENKKISKCKFPRYNWSNEPLKLIQFEAIIGPAFVVPDMSKNVIAVSKKPMNSFTLRGSLLIEADGLIFLRILKTADLFFQT
jgi:hypothetical protein